MEFSGFKGGEESSEEKVLKVEWRKNEELRCSEKSWHKMKYGGAISEMSNE